jgi:hypothetical protein
MYDIADVQDADAGRACEDEPASAGQSLENDEPQRTVGDSSGGVNQPPTPTSSL